MNARSYATALLAFWLAAAVLSAIILDLIYKTA